MRPPLVTGLTAALLYLAILLAGGALLGAAGGAALGRILAAPRR